MFRGLDANERCKKFTPALSSEGNEAFVIAALFIASLVASFAGESCGGVVLLANRIGGAVNAPIFLPTCEAAGTMDAIVAQLFLEKDDGEFTPLEPHGKFRMPTSTIPVGA